MIDSDIKYIYMPLYIYMYIQALAILYKILMYYCIYLIFFLILKQWT